MKAHIHSGVDSDGDEDNRQWNAYVAITMPDTQVIDFTTGWSVQEEAECWRTELETILDGSTVTLPNRDNLPWLDNEDEINFEVKRDIQCMSLSRHLMELKGVLRDIYAFLPPLFQEQVDALLKPDEPTTVESEREMRALVRPVEPK